MSSDHKTTCGFPGCTASIDADRSYCSAHRTYLERVRVPGMLRVAQLTQSNTNGLDNEIKLARLMVQMKLKDIDPNDPNALLAHSPDILLQTELISKLVTANHKILKESGEMLSEQQALVLIDSITAMLQEEFANEPERLSKIQARLVDIIGATLNESSTKTSGKSTE